jgi:hypothetical protein
MLAAWIICLLTAVWFFWIGKKYRQNPFVWALQGALLSLPTAAIILGLCDAAYIPLSHKEEVSYRIKSLIFAILPILVFGGCVMLVLWRRSRNGDGKNVTST